MTVYEYSRTVRPTIGWTPYGAEGNGEPTFIGTYLQADDKAFQEMLVQYGQKKIGDKEVYKMTLKVDTACKGTEKQNCREHTSRQFCFSISLPLGRR